MNKILGIDYGSKKIGIAISGEDEKTALPLKTVLRRGALKEIKRVVKEFNILSVIIGESLNIKGEDNPIMEEIRKFKSQMENEIGLQVTLGNEIFTTSAAKRVQGHHEKIDSSAAALILQTYLDQKWRK